MGDMRNIKQTNVNGDNVVYGNENPSVEELIEKLGPKFRGLWISNFINAMKNGTDHKWSVTFIWQGQYVETEPCDSMYQALIKANYEICGTEEV